MDLDFSERSASEATLELDDLFERRPDLKLRSVRDVFSYKGLVWLVFGLLWLDVSSVVFVFFYKLIIKRHRLLPAFSGWVYGLMLLNVVASVGFFARKKIAWAYFLAADLIFLANNIMFCLHKGFGSKLLGVPVYIQICGPLLSSVTMLTKGVRTYQDVSDQYFNWVLLLSILGITVLACIRFSLNIW
jgi:hypothetical protein